MPIFGVKAPADAQRAAGLIVEMFLHEGAAQVLAEERFADFMTRVGSLSWSEAARELDGVVDLKPDERVILALVARRLADKRSNDENESPDS
ncbi:hypothetical protein K0651_11700 [Ornithinimicrobium sp. Arc0846-15]|nr:hypothetical protein [Ornithinimicrobium laminariae]